MPVAKKSRFAAWMTRMFAAIRRVNQSPKFRTTVSFCENLGKLVIILTAVNWLLEAPERRQIKEASAWSVVNLASHNTADGGRVSQLRLLNDDGVSLAGVNLLEPHLTGLHLMGADLVDANFAGSTLIDAEFKCGRTKLFSSRRYLCTDLTRSYFGDANIDGAVFDGALLRNAVFGTSSGEEPLQPLQHVSFREAILWGATFEGIDFLESDFSGARITSAKFKKVHFKAGTLGQAGNQFTKARITDVDLSDTDLDAKDLADQGAYYCRVKFRDGSTISNSCDDIDAVAPSPHWLMREHFIEPAEPAGALDRCVAGEHHRIGALVAIGNRPNLEGAEAHWEFFGEFAFLDKGFAHAA